MTVTFDTVTVVLSRQGHHCMRCETPIVGERGRDWSVHHRRPRGMGGSRRDDTDTPVNLLAVCGSGTTGCHGYIESHRAEALTSGWLVPQSADPARTAVLVDRESRWVYLTEDGYAEAPPAEPAPATTPETARCACSHLVVEHQAVTRYSVPPGRSSRAKLRPKIRPTTSREYCTRCDCKGPR